MTDEKKPEPVKQEQLPMVMCKGEGYITRKETGEKIPFTFEAQGRL